MLEAILEVIGEFLLQLILQALVELGLQAMAEPFENEPNAWFAAVGYSLFGMLFGGLSLIFFPRHLVSESWRWLNLIVTPVAIGALMAAKGAWQSRHEGSELRFDKFAYGFLFALGLALVRFRFGMVHGAHP